MRLSIATWNINSVRLRIGLVARFLEEQKPDVLCLQETKCPDGQFPHSEFQRLGYKHIAINGQKGYHGVAVVSRLPILDSAPIEFCAKGDSRHMRVTLGGKAEGLGVHNFYVPAGGDIPDPALNDKFEHKLAFLDEMTALFSAGGASAATRRDVLVGDLNVAPLEHDVWSHKALLDVVSHTPIEIERLAKLQAAGDWRDALRKFVPANEKLYTWWSYRAADWAQSNKGRRLDHIWVSPALEDSVKAMRVHREARSWERPSDHAPVSIEVAL